MCRSDGVDTFATDLLFVLCTLKVFRQTSALCLLALCWLLGLWYLHLSVAQLRLVRILSVIIRCLLEADYVLLELPIFQIAI